MKKEIAKSKTLFEVNNDNPDYHAWLLKIQKRNNLLMMVVLDNDQILASFNSDYFLPMN